MKPECKINSQGNKEWYLNGVLHREDGPAVEYANGTKQWLIDGRLHREDGPAIEWPNGTKQWWLNGRLIEPEENLIEIPETEEEMLSLINEMKFVKINGEYVYVKRYIKSIDWFYNKYRLLF